MTTSINSVLLKAK